MKRSISTTFAALALAFTHGSGAQQFVYPAKGQSPQQQQKDEGECQVWASQQSGFDPASPPPEQGAAKAPTTPTGTTPGAGARGAARGAIVGGIAGDAGAGAAAGAAAGRAQSRRDNVTAAQQQQQTATQQSQQKQAAYARARAACLEGRGYTVK